MSTGAVPTVNSVKEHGMVRDKGLFDPITGRRRRSRCTPAHLESHPEATRTDSVDQALQPYPPMLATANVNIATSLGISSDPAQHALRPNPNPPSTVTPARHLSSTAPSSAIAPPSSPSSCSSPSPPPSAPRVTSRLEKKPPRRASPHSPPSPNAHSATSAWTESLAIRESTTPSKSSLRPQGVCAPPSLAARRRSPRTPRLFVDGGVVGEHAHALAHGQCRVVGVELHALLVSDGDFTFAFAAPPSGHGRGNGRGLQHGRGRSVEDVADGKGKKTKPMQLLELNLHGAERMHVMPLASYHHNPRILGPGPLPVPSRDFKLLYETIVLLHFRQASFYPAIVDLIRNCTSTFLRLEIPATAQRSCCAAYAYAYSNKLMRLSWCRSTYQPRSALWRIANNRVRPASDFTLEHDIKVIDAAPQLEKSIRPDEKNTKIALEPTIVVLGGEDTCIGEDKGEMCGRSTWAAAQGSEQTGTAWHASENRLRAESRLKFRRPVEGNE
ncbi:hypothetical protein B0H13DRAFT_1865759 [Mycena leptocephala]|nr:hypothetical protein B0H13DRAFT_1865759 [Mycena leptocephala]